MRKGAIIACACICALLTGCKAAKVVYTEPEPIVRTEYVYRDRMLRDTIHVYEGEVVRTINDTVFIVKTKTEYKELWRTDTVVKVDSVPKPYPIYIEKKQERQRGGLPMGLAIAAIVIIAAGIAYLRAKL